MKAKYFLFFTFNIIVATLYYFMNYLPIPSKYVNIASIGWNLIFGLILALIFIRRDLFTQLKKINFKWLILGLSLTSFVAYIGNYLYSVYIGTPTVNAFYYNLTNEFLFIYMPILVFGEEIISTNLTTAINRLGLNFWLGSGLVAVLFAMWHIKSFGFVPIQLLMVIAPIRLALNYTWKESNSIWTVWIVHVIFNIIAFKVFY